MSPKLDLDRLEDVEVEMAINAELNEYTVLTDADPFFIAAEMFFCFFFTAELVMRFWAGRAQTSCTLNLQLSSWGLGLKSWIQPQDMPPI